LAKGDPDAMKFSHCRLVLKVRHDRSEDAPTSGASQGQGAGAGSTSAGAGKAEEELEQRLRAVHHMRSEEDEKAFMEAAKKGREKGALGGSLSKESDELKIRKFMEKDPPPLGRIRVHGISCIQYYGTELTVGDIHGKVFVWNMAEKKCMWDLQAHTGRVVCLQTDAVRVVTGGGDGLVRVFDVMTGRAVQTFQAHNPCTAVMMIQFDPIQLLTGGADGHLKRWLWSQSGGLDSGEAGMVVTRHFVGPGDTLKSIAAKYGSSLKEIMSWNKMKDGRELYGGLSIIVGRTELFRRAPGDDALVRSSPDSGGGGGGASRQPFEVAKETPLYHPSFGLKEMELSIYKGRPPRKGDEFADAKQIAAALANSHVKGSFQTTREVRELKVVEEGGESVYNANERAAHVGHAERADSKVDSEGLVVEREAPAEAPHEPRLT